MKATFECLSYANNPNQVKSVNPNDLASVPILDREGCMVLYGPRTVQENVTDTHEIVVNCERSSYRFEKMNLKIKTSNAETTHELF